MRRTLVRMGLLTLLSGFLGLAVGSSVHAEVQLPALISDHMVLQQGMPARIWGVADPGEQVAVTFREQRASTAADADGNWQVELAPTSAGGPFVMVVEGENRILVEDMLVGEVWVCSGQSNMGLPVSASNNAQQEIAEANYPAIRLFQVEMKVADEPLPATNGSWSRCSPESIPNFTAVGYFFGRELNRSLQVPVGLIQSAWGGTPAESWTTHDTLAADPILQPILRNWEKVLENYPATMERYEEQMKEWEAAAEKARQQGEEPPRRPSPPTGPGHPWTPSGLFNAMIHPLLDFAIRGAIWYQGESNAGRAYQYRELFPAMIRDWRREWAEGDFPFYFVQLANFMAVKPEPGESAWAELREAQLMTLQLPNTGMAVIIDIGEADDIHPRNKQDVGRRLALNALAQTYGQDVPYSGPIYAGKRLLGNRIRILFDHTDGGLVAKDGELKGFAVAGPDRRWVWAEARIEGDTVVVSSPEVPDPVAVRYAWADNPVCNLYNGAGLPASPFRTDNWPGVTAGAR